MGLWEFFGLTLVTVEQITWSQFVRCAETTEAIWAQRKKDAAEQERENAKAERVKGRR